MAAHEPFRTEPVGSWTRDLEKAKKKRYKKNPGGAEKFERLIRDLVDAICADPFARSYGAGIDCKTESYPVGYAQDECMVRKARFRMPGLDGAVAFARVLFEVNRESSCVTLLAFYTHDDYPGNYSPRDLADRLREGRG